SSGTAPADVIEVTWEPDDADRAEASSARLQALTQEDYLDELTWEGPALDELSTAAAAAAVSAPVPPAAVTPAATAAPAAPPSGQAPAKPGAIPVLTLTDTA